MFGINIFAMEFEMRLALDDDREWVEVSRGGRERADVLVSKDPVVGFVLHMLSPNPYEWEIQSLIDALQCCSRFQIEVPLV